MLSHIPEIRMETALTLAFCAGVQMHAIHRQRPKHTNKLWISLEWTAKRFGKILFISMPNTGILIFQLSKVYRKSRKIWIDGFQAFIVVSGLRLTCVMCHALAHVILGTVTKVKIPFRIMKNASTNTVKECISHV